MNTSSSTLKPEKIQEIFSENIQLLAENKQLKEEIAWFRKQTFGQKADKLPLVTPEEINLFAIPPKAEPISSKTTEVAAHTRVQPGHGRKPWPKHLERVEEIISPPADDLCCQECGCEKVCIGEDVTELLERRPDPYFVRRIVRPKYACKVHPELGVTQAKALPRMIEKGNIGDSVVLQVILDKYLNHLPLTRQEKIFKRIQIDISPSTMVGWLDEFARKTEPIVAAMQKRILRGGIAYSDDTSIPVLMEDKPGAAHRGAMWLYSNGSDAVVFEYSSGRSQSYPMNWLNGFKGYLHSDGYTAYLGVHNKGGIKPVYCFAHARRKFLAAIESGDTQALRSFSLINRLFAVDRYARNQKLGIKAFKEIRARVSSLILKKLHEHWIILGPTVLPKSLLGVALNYVLTRKEGFATFLKSPRLSLDNNLSERELRRVVLGRKNYMFCGSEEGARRAAIVYSLAATCERIGIDTYRYCLEVMRRLSANINCDPKELMPHKIAAELLKP